MIIQHNKQSRQIPNRFEKQDTGLSFRRYSTGKKKLKVNKMITKQATCPVKAVCKCQLISWHSPTSEDTKKIEIFVFQRAKGEGRRDKRGKGKG